MPDQMLPLPDVLKYGDLGGDYAPGSYSPEKILSRIPHASLALLNWLHVKEYMESIPIFGGCYDEKYGWLPQHGIGPIEEDAFAGDFEEPVRHIPIFESRSYLLANNATIKTCIEKYEWFLSSQYENMASLAPSVRNGLSTINWSPADWIKATKAWRKDTYSYNGKAVDILKPFANLAITDEVWAPEILTQHFFSDDAYKVFMANPTKGINPAVDGAAVAMLCDNAKPISMDWYVAIPGIHVLLGELEKFIGQAAIRDGFAKPTPGGGWEVNHAEKSQIIENLVRCKKFSLASMAVWGIEHNVPGYKPSPADMNWLTAYAKEIMQNPDRMDVEMKLANIILGNSLDKKEIHDAIEKAKNSGVDNTQSVMNALFCPEQEEKFAKQWREENAQRSRGLPNPRAAAL